MGLTVIGTSTQATLLATAASLRAGQPVAVVGSGEAPTRTLACRGLVGRGQATLDYRVAPGSDDFVVVAAASVGEVLQLYERHARCAQQTVLIPGGAGGALRAADLAATGGAGPVSVAEASGFPFLGDVAGDTATVTARKVRLPIGGADPKATMAIVDALRQYVPGVEAVDALVTSLANTNHIIHPAIALANLARIEQGASFLFYREGIAPATMRLVSAIDGERLLITDRLGLPNQSAEEWFDRFYGDQGFEGRDLYAGLSTFAPFAASLGPKGTDHRYLVDDVRYGIAVYEALGAKLDIATPMISAVVSALCTATGLDLRDAAPALAALLLAHHGTAMAPRSATSSQAGEGRRH